MSTTKEVDPDSLQIPHDQPAEPEYAEDLIQLRDRLAADGVHIQIPRIGARFNLPEPFEVEGETASEIIIRWRHEP